MIQFKSLLSELFDTSNTFDWRLVDEDVYDDGRVIYTTYQFSTDQTDYEVKIKPYLDMDYEGLIPPHRVDFRSGLTKMTGEHEALKVISTVVDICEDFVSNHNKIKQLAIFAQKDTNNVGPTSQLDSKRGRIYQYILKKKLPTSKIKERSLAGEEFYLINLK